MRIPESIKYLKDEKWDVKRGQAIYSGVYTQRLVEWIITGRIKKGEVTVWRGGLSGWAKPEELPELIPFFKQWQAGHKLKKKRRVSIHRKKEIKAILIIDDEPDTCDLLKMVLSKKYEVNTVTTGKGGINFVKKNKPDFVFLDLRLNDIDGLVVLSRIKKVSPKTTVAMISAYGDETAKKEAEDLGAFTFLDKPLFQKKIFNAINMANA